MLTTLKLNYSFYRNFRYVLIITALGVVTYQLFNINNPRQMVGRLGKSANWIDYFWFLLIDQFLFELISMFIFFKAIILYARIWGLNKLRWTTGQILKYELSFLPLFLVVFFIFNPITQSIRFLYEQSPTWSAKMFWNEYWYNWNVYFVYLAPILLIGYVTLNINLLREYNQSLEESLLPQDNLLAEDTEQALADPPKKEFATRIIALDKGYEKPINLKEVYWFEVKERQYFATTKEAAYRVQKKINELEEVLNPNDFLRINRSVIININQVDKFSPYFNGKYVLKMKGFEDQEFIVPKARVKSLKVSLEKV